jgi:hypothetical protein
MSMTTVVTINRVALIKKQCDQAVAKFGVIAVAAVQTMTEVAAPDLFWNVAIPSAPWASVCCQSIGASERTGVLGARV